MIRLAKNKDIQEILELFNSNINLTGADYKFTKNDILEYLKNKMCRLFVYETDNKIIGAVSLEIWKTAKVGYIGEIIIDKAHRGKGIGKKLTNHIEKLLKKLKIPTIFLFVDENNKEMINLMDKLKYGKGRKYIGYTKENKIFKKENHRDMLIILALIILQTFINIIFFFNL